MAEPTTPRFSLLSFHFPAFFPFSTLSSRIFVNFSNQGWLQAFAELRDPKCNHSILGHRYRFLASFSPSLSVLLFRGNTHGITSFPTRALHSLFPTPNQRIVLAFSCGTSGHATPPRFFLLPFHSPSLPFTCTRFLRLFRLSSPSLPEFPRYLPHLVTKRANYLEAEEARPYRCTFRVNSRGIRENLRQECTQLP